MWGNKTLAAEKSSTKKNFSSSPRKKATPTRDTHTQFFETVKSWRGKICVFHKKLFSYSHYIFRLVYTQFFAPHFFCESPFLEAVLVTSFRFAYKWGLFGTRFHAISRSGKLLLLFWMSLHFFSLSQLIQALRGVVKNGWNAALHIFFWLLCDAASDL